SPVSLESTRRPSETRNLQSKALSQAALWPSPDSDWPAFAGDIHRALCAQRRRCVSLGPRAHESVLLTTRGISSGEITQRLKPGNSIRARGSSLRPRL